MPAVWSEGKHLLDVKQAGQSVNRAGRIEADPLLALKVEGGRDPSQGLGDAYNAQ
jgi:hypothetical protein